MAFTVSQVARVSGVSVRALHHYDEIGLLCPSGRSPAGYRLYDDGDLQRLQQVLFFRELEFPLPEIQRMLADPDFDLRSALRMQRQLLEEKTVRTNALIAAVDAALARLEKGKEVMERQDDENENKDKDKDKDKDRRAEDMFAVWREFKQEAYEEEVKERWGDTDAYKESKQRTARYTKRDWEVLGKEAQAIYLKIIALLEAGTAPSSSEAMDAAEEHRQHISRWFYPCPPGMHRGLGQMYVADPRFTANIDRMRAGLSQYLSEAFAANADRS